MWGSSIIGFGSYHYKGKSGREGDWMLTGFSPRKQNLTLYLMGGFDTHAALLKKLGSSQPAWDVCISRHWTCGQEGLERVGAGVCQENETAQGMGEERGAEISVLNGIEEMHWPILKQIAVEAHTVQLREQVCEILSQHGFDVYTDLGLSSPGGASLVYAKRQQVN